MKLSLTTMRQKTTNFKAREEVSALATSEAYLVLGNFAHIQPPAKEAGGR